MVQSGLVRPKSMWKPLSAMYYEEATIEMVLTSNTLEMTYLINTFGTFV